MRFSRPASRNFPSPGKVDAFAYGVRGRGHLPVVTMIYCVRKGDHSRISILAIFPRVTPVRWMRKTRRRQILLNALLACWYAPIELMSDPTLQNPI